MLEDRERFAFRFDRRNQSSIEIEYIEMWILGQKEARMVEFIQELESFIVQLKMIIDRFAKSESEP